MKRIHNNALTKPLTNAILSFSLIFSGGAYSTPADVDKPIIIVGASFASASFPFNDALEAPLGGVAVNLGAYLSFGNALIKDPRLPGYVINEAQAGATTFDHPGCNPGPGCDNGNWEGYEKQLYKGLKRVSIPLYPPISTAKYAVITIANDCLHSDAFGIPQDQAVPCSMNEINAYIDRLLNVGQQALNAGITPIFDIYPHYSSLNLSRVAAQFGLLWIADEAYYNQLRNTHLTRMTSELPGAIVMDIWADMETDDGIHPNEKSMRKAAAMISNFIFHNN